MLGRMGASFSQMAVAVGGDVHHQRDMEAGAAVHDCLGVFGHTAVELGIGGSVVDKGDGVEVAGADTAAAAHAVLGDNLHLTGCLIKTQTIVGALMQAALAAAAGIGIDYRLAVGVLFLLAGTAIRSPCRYS